MLDVTDVAMTLGAVPLLWTALLARRGITLDPAYWWIAIGLYVSFIADATTGLLQMSTWWLQWIPVLLYPLCQSGLVGLPLLLTLRAKLLFVAWLGTAGIAAVLVSGWQARDPILPTAGGLALVEIVRRFKALPEMLRAFVFVYFGVGAIAWLMFCWWADPFLRPWYEFQLVRLEGICLFCWATLAMEPRLRVIRS